jgi:hypothetical protein
VAQRLSERMSRDDSISAVEYVEAVEALEVENQTLKEQNAENARWAARHKATKEEWGKQLTKAEAEVKQQDKALMIQENRYWGKVKELKDAVDAGEEWRLRWVEEESWRKGLELRLKNATEFIENFEDSGEEYIWLSELKKLLEGSV